ncbi:hypothetical protein QBC35DRAFT_45322 [Podospora australis]|uniref:Chromo domain-containing protein n=1 Tax=Podospora australis TaxID=1536484 RepID=A0AAN6WZC0_9PEZI|nr:hypothetical protein QBC35DRAFT_45322 [Podospora australis]
MPPAISDHEEVSDSELKSWAKKSARGKKAATDKEAEPITEEFEDEDAPGNDASDEEGDEEDDGNEEAEDVYVVERIVTHTIGKDGEPLYQVKWEGYDDEADLTWEPEENLTENATDILTEYLKSIGGREALFDSVKGLKSKKRGRPGSTAGTPQPKNNKRSKRNGSHPGDSEPPASVTSARWKPPAGSWEDHIAQLDACEDEESGKLMVYLTWKNGQKTQHETSVIYSRCPQKMLQFYERHVRIIKRDPDSESVTTPN